ncbi:TS1R1 protein, partial [Mystacornis crossleyi]|nr:TS1R1 protein [Mystacornis crossleyi]
MPPPALLRLCLCAAAAASAASFTLRGDHQLAGLFPLHAAAHRDAASLLVRGCDDAAIFKSHGYCLSQALRFAVEEINNSSTLLPNVTLGYDIYDTCSETANFHATLCALARKGKQDVQVLPSFQHYKPQAVAVIGPDSTRLALTTAAVLSLFLVPEVSAAPAADEEQGTPRREGFRESGLGVEEPGRAGNAAPLCALSQDPSQ